MRTSDLHTRAAAQLWALLYGTWGSPRRAEYDRKYSELESYYSFNPAHLAAHLAGTATYAATLAAAGATWAGCKDYDSADEVEILSALDQAQQKGITAVAFLQSIPAGISGYSTIGRMPSLTFVPSCAPSADRARVKITRAETRSGCRSAITESRKRAVCSCSRMACASILIRILPPALMR